MLDTLVSTSAAQTEQIAATIGSQLRGGEVIELVSDLGGGKTTFTRGLVHGAGSSDRVASPTFTVSRVYEGPKFAVHHFDMYRLAEAGMVGHEFEDLLGDTQVVIVAEWANVLDNVLPADRLRVTITRTGDETRQLEFEYPRQLNYVVRGLI